MSSRTEAATPRRLREARARGVVPLSARAVGTVAMASAVAAVGATVHQLRVVFVRLLTVGFHSAAGEVVRRPGLHRVVSDGLTVMAPVLVTATLGATLATVIQTRFLLAPGALSRVRAKSPRGGWTAALVSLLSGCVLLCVGALAAEEALTVTSWQVATPGALAARALALTRGVTLRLLVVAGGLAVVDMVFVSVRHARALRMTRAEVDRERRDDQGSPEVRRALRDAMESLSDGDNRGRDTDPLARATLVLSSDGEVVALRHAPDETDAPVLLVRADGAAASALRADAVARGVLVVTAPAAVGALREARVGRPIPERAYEPVAAVIAEATPPRPPSGTPPRA